MLEPDISNPKLGAIGFLIVVMLGFVVGIFFTMRMVLDPIITSPVLYALAILIGALLSIITGLLFVSLLSQVLSETQFGKHLQAIMSKIPNIALLGRANKSQKSKKK